MNNVEEVEKDVHWWVEQIQMQMPDALGHKANHDVVFSRGEELRSYPLVTGSPLHEIEFGFPRRHINGLVIFV